MPGSLATAQGIAEVERQLDIAFPDSYRWFLQTIGAGDIGPAWIYGVDADSDYFLPKALLEWPAAVAAGLVPVNDDGCGNAFGFLRVGGDDVWGWDHETGQIAMTHADFLDFVAEIAFEI